jgi:hypothetical protein
VRLLHRLCKACSRRWRDVVVSARGGSRTRTSTSIAGRRHRMRRRRSRSKRAAIFFSILLDMTVAHDPNDAAFTRPWRSICARARPRETSKGSPRSAQTVRRRTCHRPPRIRRGRSSARAILQTAQLHKCSRPVCVWLLSYQLRDGSSAWLPTADENAARVRRTSKGGSASESRRAVDGSRFIRGFWPQTDDADRFEIAPNRAWVGDITYLWTREGWAYLAC